MKFEVKESFVRSLTKLEKKYRHIRTDLEFILQEIEEDCFRGVAIPGFGGLVWKIRVASSDMKSGKRGGFRLIYAVKEKENIIILLFVYTKAEREGIQRKKIKKLLE